MIKTELNNRQKADLARIMAKDPKLTEAAALDMVPCATTMEVMANGGYTKIMIRENPAGADQKWGPCYVAVNDYDVRIERSAISGESPKEAIVSDLILKNLYAAARTRPEIMVQPLGTYTAMQAHEERLLGNIPVYPAKVTPDMAADPAKKGLR